MSIAVFPMGYLETNCYIVNKGEDAIMVDPGGTKENGLTIAIAYIKNHGLNLLSIILTHMHFDHIYGVAEMLQLYPSISAYANKADLEILNSPLAGASMFGLPPTEPFDPSFIDEGKVNFGNITGEIRYTPGHTPGSLALYLPDEHAVLSGDTVFHHSLGRTDLLGGSQNAIINSVIDKIFTLPNDTIIYPGHGQETTVNEEKLYNPYF